MATYGLGRFEVTLADEPHVYTPEQCEAILAQFDSTPAEFQPELDAILADVAAQEFASRHPEEVEEPERWDGLS